MNGDGNVPIEEFFDLDDGFLVSVNFGTSGLQASGYFSVLESEFYLDDTESVRRAELVCGEFTGSADIIGESTTIQGAIYRVNSVEPDGTGLITIGLMRA